MGGGHYPFRSFSKRVAMYYNSKLILPYMGRSNFYVLVYKSVRRKRTNLSCGYRFISNVGVVQIYVYGFKTINFGA